MIGEYTTVTAVRHDYLAGEKTTDDALILSIIRQVTREINDISNRKFIPVVATHLYNLPKLEYLYLDDDALELTEVLNGDGSTISSGSYMLYPLNRTPKNLLVIKKSAVAWTLPADGEAMGAVEISGIWGYNDSYSDAWDYIGVCGGSVTSTATSGSAGAGTLTAGDITMMGSEYIYVETVTAGSGATDTITMIRGINGSTAASHSAAAKVYKWTIDNAVEMIARRAVAGYYKLRSNPMQETVVVDGTAFTTPKDVSDYIDRSLGNLGLIKTGFA